MKKTALEIFCHKYLPVFSVNKKEVKEAIRDVADDDEGFENIVFELGVSVLAKEYVKANGGKYNGGD